MSSGISAAPQNLFYSTHNALHHCSLDESKVLVDVVELEGRRNCTLSVYPFSNVEVVKRLIIRKVQLPPSTNISEIRILYRGTELPNHRTLSPFTGDRGVSRFRLHWTFKNQDIRYGFGEMGLRAPPVLRHLISEINLAIQRGMNPKLTLDGTGGTYILTNTNRQSIAMFKPRDEEAFSPNNPRGYEGKLGQKGFRSGVLSGEGAAREVAAFLLDAHCGNFMGVPATTKVEACHSSFSYKNFSAISPCIYSHFNAKTDGSAVHNTDKLPWKEGSLQQFVKVKDTCGDYDPRVFSVGDVHRIGVFDIRVLNLDRNDGNILVQQFIPGCSDLPTMQGSLNRHSRCSKSKTRMGSFTRRGGNSEAGGQPEDFADPSLLTPDGKISKYHLVPIDHGLILPDTMDVGDVDLVWLSWPQCKVPFSVEELGHIFSLDPDKDALRLSRKLDLRDECLRTMRVSTRVLQIGASMKLTLSQIAAMVVRSGDFSTPSILERTVKTALFQAFTAISAAALTQPTRLPGSLLLDLHLAAGNRSTLRARGGTAAPQSRWSVERILPAKSAAASTGILESGGADNLQHLCNSKARWAARAAERKDPVDVRIHSSASPAAHTEKSTLRGNDVNGQTYRFDAFVGKGAAKVLRWNGGDGGNEWDELKGQKRLQSSTKSPSPRGHPAPTRRCGMGGLKRSHSTGVPGEPPSLCVSFSRASSASGVDSPTELVAGAGSPNSSVSSSLSSWYSKSGAESSGGKRRSVSSTQSSVLSSGSSTASLSSSSQLSASSFVSPRAAPEKPIIGRERPVVTPDEAASARRNSNISNSNSSSSSSSNSNGGLNNNLTDGIPSTGACNPLDESRLDNPTIMSSIKSRRFRLSHVSVCGNASTAEPQLQSHCGNVPNHRLSVLPNGGDSGCGARGIESVPQIPNVSPNSCATTADKRRNITLNAKNGSHDVPGFSVADFGQLQISQQITHSHRSRQHQRRQHRHQHHLTPQRTTAMRIGDGIEGSGSNNSNAHEYSGNGGNPDAAPERKRSCSKSTSARQSGDLFVRSSGRSSRPIVDPTGSRRISAALQRQRGTSSRISPPNVDSTWTLLDSNRKVIPLNWSNKFFERTFFDCFELLIRHYVNEKHAEWRSYPYNGDGLTGPAIVAVYSSDGGGGPCDGATNYTGRRAQATSLKHTPTAQGGADAIFPQPPRPAD